MKTKILLVGGFEETRYLAHSPLDKGYRVTAIFDCHSPRAHRGGLAKNKVTHSNSQVVKHKFLKIL